MEVINPAPVASAGEKFVSSQSMSQSISLLSVNEVNTKHDAPDSETDSAMDCSEPIDMDSDVVVPPLLSPIHSLGDSVVFRRQIMIESEASAENLALRLEGASQDESFSVTSHSSQPIEKVTAIETHNEVMFSAAIVEAPMDSSSANEPVTMGTNSKGGESDAEKVQNDSHDQVSAEEGSAHSPGVAVGPPPPPAGPAPIDIVFSFDTTGSMSRCIEEVQTKVKEMIQRLFMDIPSLRIALIAHGDYCDAEHFYVTQQVDFSYDVDNLCNFITNVTGTGGGDWPECYELVMRKARTELSWRPGTQRSVVMIGDAIPHQPGEGGNDARIDWREEVQGLKQMGVPIYAVQCLATGHDETADSFWSELSARSGGRHLHLDQFQTIVDMVMAICYRERGSAYFEAYEREVRAREGAGMRNELNYMFDALRDGEKGGPEITAPGPLPGPSIPQNKRPAAKKGAAKKQPTKKNENATVAQVALKLRKKVTTLPPKVRKTAGKAATQTKNKTEPKHTKVSPSRLPRENVPHRQFEKQIGRLCRSPWWLAVTNKKPTNEKDEFRPCMWFPGFYSKDILNYYKRRSAFYEFAVQPAPGQKKYPVYCSFSAGINNDKPAMSYLLKSHHLRKKIENILTSNPQTQIFVRRMVFYRKDRSNPTQHREMIKSYDYAWHKRSRAGNFGTRDVIKRGVCIA